MSQLWLGRRFQLNERGSHAAWGKAGSDRVSVEIAPEALEQGIGDPATFLLKRHASIQKAARAMWAAGDATPVAHGFSGPLDHYRITLSHLESAKPD